MPMSVSNSNEYDLAQNLATTNREGGRPASVTGSGDEESGQQAVLPQDLDPCGCATRRFGANLGDWTLIARI